MTAGRIDRGDHIETAFMVPYGRSVYAAVAVRAGKVCLGRTGKAIPHLLPVDEVPAVKYRNSGEILKSAVDKVEVISGTAYARICMEPWKNGIGES